MLRAYFQDTITVIYSNGTDQWGEPIAATETEMKAYIDFKTHLVRNLAGEQVVSSGIVYVMPATTIQHDDFIEYNSKRYAILKINPGKDFSGNHQEIHLA